MDRSLLLGQVLQLLLVVLTPHSKDPPPNPGEYPPPLLLRRRRQLRRLRPTVPRGRASIIRWLIHLNGMRAHEELGEGERRECEFEVQAAYNGFKGVLG